ncbi:MAG: transporter substrate-binding domain-containing protein [Bacteroidia bacterium]|nr:transporter substrate-binding domain-containing protein [Bacteroidia bacterium]
MNWWHNTYSRFVTWLANHMRTLQFTLKHKSYFLLILLLFIPFILPHDSNYHHIPKPTDSDFYTYSLKDIKSRGIITAITNYNSTNYFIFKGEPMGFQYEMLQSFASYLGVKLDIKVVNDLGDAFGKLETAKCDILAINLTVTKERSTEVSFTEPFSQTRQILVQRKPDNWTEMSEPEIESSLIRNQVNLAGKTVYVEKKSVYARRLRTLSDEIGGTINVVELPSYDTEQLINLVASGEIDYTVSDENTAEVNRIFNPNIDILTPVSFSQNLAWAVKKDNTGLLTIINKWLREYKNTESFHYAYNKYFKYNKYTFQAQKEFHSKHEGKISIFDNVIRRESDKLKWDWRLLASLIYQESHFIPRARGDDGAYGLMQLMPGTAKKMGLSKSSTPEDNIRAGVNYLKKLVDGYSDVKDISEKTKYVLAAYNAGPGHIEDARKLAKEYGKNPSSWADVAEYLKNISKPEFYNDPVVKFGYYNANHALEFVKEVLERYKHYQETVKD